MHFGYMGQWNARRQLNRHIVQVVINEFENSSVICTTGGELQVAEKSSVSA